MDDDASRKLKVCVDRVLPREIERRRRMLTAATTTAPSALPMGGPTRLAIVGVKRWDNGRTLPVSFLDGDLVVQRRVKAHAMEWSKHANIAFEFGDHQHPAIRISFLGPGSWSYIGTDAASIDAKLPTMNFGWLYPETADDEYERTVLHEFGHAMGAIHEHQSPGADIPWDRNAVYEYYQGPPNNWSREDIDINLFQLYDETTTQYTEFDDGSIMLYPIPEEFTIGDYAVGWNRTLSDMDKAFMRITYPSTSLKGVELALGGVPTVASIRAHGEEDRFIFTAPTDGRYIVETTGPTDVVMAVAGPADAETVIAEDDDSGCGRNARIEADLAAGVYTARVWHCWPTGTGDYEVSLRASE